MQCATLVHVDLAMPSSAPASKNEMNHPAPRLAAPAIALTVLVLAPFVNKAFTVDDTIFLREAQHAVSDPRHPTAFVMVWDENPGRVAPTSGPLMAWLLIPTVIGAGAEWIAHTTQIFMLALAALSTVALALRIGIRPRWASAAGVLLVATPAALGMAGTAMPDVPAMALGVAGMERLLAWKHERRVHQGVLAALLLGLAPLARSHLVLVVGIGALLLAGEFWKPSSWAGGRWMLWAPIVAALSITAALVVFTRDSAAATGLVGTTMTVSVGAALASNVAAFLTHWVLVLPLALPWILLRAPQLVRRWWVFLVGLGISAALLTQAPPAMTFAPIPAIGFAVLVDVLLDGWRRRDSIQIALGLWLLIALVAAPYAHLPSKYLLASAPAAVLLVARELSSRPNPRALAIGGVTAIAGFALGIAILRADQAFAGLGRRAAEELVARPVSAGQRVWFTPHWGFQWYAEQAGGKIVTLDPPHPMPGDLLVTSDRTDQAASVQGMLVARYGNRARRIARLEERRPGGRLMDSNLGVGFFSSAWGFLPWVWSDAVLDGFDLWRVE